MLGLNETIDHLATANSVCWHSHALRKEDGHVFQTLVSLSLVNYEYSQQDIE